jgi:hypothetical protein
MRREEISTVPVAISIIHLNTGRIICEYVVGARAFLLQFLGIVV